MISFVEVDDYEIEVSTDAIGFNKLSEVNALQANSPRHYSMIDLPPTFGENFYRLKVYQIDGHYFYSNIRSVNFEINFDQVMVYPNPAEDRINIA